MQRTKIQLTTFQKEKIQQLQKKTHVIISDFGQMAITKLQIQKAQKQLSARYEQLQIFIQKFNIQLKNKYGDGQIDFENNMYLKV